MVLAFYGASGLGTEFLYLAIRINKEENRWEDMIFVDDDPAKDGTELEGLKVMPFTTALETYGKDNLQFMLSIGEPEVKDIIYKKLKDHGCVLTNLIHPESLVPPSAKLGEGIVVHKLSSIPPQSVIGNNVLIQGTTVLGHNLVLEDNVVISSLAFVGGDTHIGRNTYIAPHCCIKNGIKIGADAIVGMASVVTKDIPDRAVAFGNPCTVKRINEKGRVFSK